MVRVSSLTHSVMRSLSAILPAAISALTCALCCFFSTFTLRDCSLGFATLAGAGWREAVGPSGLQEEFAAGFAGSPLRAFHCWITKSCRSSYRLLSFLDTNTTFIFVYFSSERAWAPALRMENDTCDDLGQFMARRCAMTLDNSWLPGEVLMLFVDWIWAASTIFLCRGARLCLMIEAWDQFGRCPSVSAWTTNGRSGPYPVHKQQQMCIIICIGMWVSE